MTRHRQIWLSTSCAQIVKNKLFMKNLLLGMGLSLLAHIMIWFQANLQFFNTWAKNNAVAYITAPTIKVLVAPAPTKAKTVSRVEIGAAKISLIVPLNFGKNIPKEVLLIDCVSNVSINKPGTIYDP